MTAENLIFHLKYQFCRPFHNPHQLPVHAIGSVSNFIMLQCGYCLEVYRGYCLEVDRGYCLEVYRGYCLEVDRGYCLEVDRGYCLEVDRGYRTLCFVRH
jgi:hypothetical protein